MEHSRTPQNILEKGKTQFEKNSGRQIKIINKIKLKI